MRPLFFWEQITGRKYFANFELLHVFVFSFFLRSIWIEINQLQNGFQDEGFSIAGRDK